MHVKLEPVRLAPRCILNQVFLWIGRLLVVSVLWTGNVAADALTPKPAPSRQLSGIFAPDPEGVWRTITRTDSTSDCIGDPVAPLCAVETHLACYQRRVRDYCRIAFGPTYDDSPDYYVEDPPYSYTSYRVIKTWLAGPEDLKPRPRIGLSRKQGDLMIDLIIRACWPKDIFDPAFCSTPDVPTTYTVRRFESGWAVVDIYVPWH